MESSDNFGTNLAEETLQKLANSIQQYAASSLSGIVIPEFSGSPNEDVHEFLRRFKLATIAFSDELKCLALQRALTGAARTWAKNNLPSEPKDGDWQRAKKTLAERFEAPNRALRHQERLAKLTYDPCVGTLTSFVEEFTEVYKKVHGTQNDPDIIKSLSLRLPRSVIRNLNILSESWVDMRYLTDFYKLIKRFENQIQPYEPEEESPDKKMDVGTLTKLLKELKESIANNQPRKSDTENKDSEQTLALVQRSNPVNYPTIERLPQKVAYGTMNRYRSQGAQPYRWRREARFNRASNEPYPAQPPKRLLGNNDSLARNMDKEQQLKELRSAYIAKYGPPPGPCSYCGEDHYNRHCVFHNLNY